MRACADSGDRETLARVPLAWLTIHLAQHVILRKLVGGETKIGRSFEVTTWKYIYRRPGEFGFICMAAGVFPRML